MELFDLGRTSWLHTQLIYHALPRLERPAVVVCWPDRPYMCLGFSQALEQEVNQSFCRDKGLPVFRRAVGGGLVYLDDRQVFFQVILPKQRGWRPVDSVYRRCLQPALDVLRELGLPAEFRPAADLVVNGRKISGNGGGEIAGHPVVVGNLLLDFDFDLMVGALNWPAPPYRRMVDSRMRERLTTLGREMGRPPSREMVRELLVEAFRRRFGPLAKGEMDPALTGRMQALAKEMADPEWPEHSPRPPGGGRDVKICEGTYVRFRTDPDREVWAAWVEEDGLIKELEFGGPAPADGTVDWPRLSRKLTGLPVDGAELRAVLHSPAGEDWDNRAADLFLQGPFPGRAEIGG